MQLNAGILERKSSRAYINSSPTSSTKTRPLTLGCGLQTSLERCAGNLSAEVASRQPRFARLICIGVCHESDTRPSCGITYPPTSFSRCFYIQTAYIYLGKQVSPNVSTERRHSRCRPTDMNSARLSDTARYSASPTNTFSKKAATPDAAARGSRGSICSHFHATPPFANHGSFLWHLD